MQDYYRILKRYPALCVEDPPRFPDPVPDTSRLSSRPRKLGPGRPRSSPRALLDAIFWKLATGQKWDRLPHGFPPMRTCRKYYRRLYLGGRLYTLLLALYNHMVLQTGTDPFSLLESGLITATASHCFALSPSAPATSANYTALLFLQLANTARSRLMRMVDQDHPHSRRLHHLDISGSASLSTGQLPGHPAPFSQSVVKSVRTLVSRWEGHTSLNSPGASPVDVSILSLLKKLADGASDLPPAVVKDPAFGFEPLESSLAWKKWRLIERTHRSIPAEAGWHPADVSSLADIPPDCSQSLILDT